MTEPTMKTQTRWVVLLLAFVLVPAGYSDRKSDEGQPARGPRAAPAPAPEATPAPAQRPPASSTPATPEPAPELRAGQEPAPSTKRPATPPEPTKPEPAKPEPAKPEPTKPEPAKPEPATPEPARPQEPTPAPATPSALQEPVATAAGKTTAKEFVVLTGAPLGGVRLAHTLHVERAGNACTRCHHASRPEKPATAPQQACADCHTKVAAAPMKTKYQAAFHNPTAQSGTCIDCHKAENAKGKHAPVKCTECHKKENR
jgi:hypothetical protein